MAGGAHVTAVMLVVMAIGFTAPALSGTDPHAPAKAAAPAAAKPAAHAPAKPAAPAAAKPADLATAKPAAHASPKPAEHAPAKTTPAAAGHEKAAGVPAAAAAAPKQAPNSLLEVHERIMTRAAEVAAGWKKKAPGATPRQAAAPTPVPARVRVVWRAAVSWPTELSGDAIETPAADRIPVTWGEPAQ